LASPNDKDTRQTPFFASEKNIYSVQIRGACRRRQFSPYQKDTCQYPQTLSS